MTDQLTFAVEVPVTLTCSFADILGDCESAMPLPIRRGRWAGWLRLARRDDDARELASIWTSKEGCVCPERGRCKHLKGRSWCSHAGLPASVNPVLSMRHGMIGMACMGGGYEPKE